MKLEIAPHTGPKLHVLPLNINGLRANLRRDLPAKLLKDLRVGIYFLTESRLRSVDLKNIKNPKLNALAAPYRPSPFGERIGGGASILVHTNFAAEKLPEVEGLPPTMRRRFRKVYPTANPDTAM